MMDTDQVKSAISEWLAPELEARNLFLVDVKISIGRKIEVFADSDTGIQIEECAVLSRLLESKLDGSGLVPENYILEVSSPGMANPLKVPRQYRRRIGRRLDIQLTGGEQISAILQEADEDGVRLLEYLAPLKASKSAAKKAGPAPEPRQWNLAYSQIKKAVLHFDF